MRAVVDIKRVRLWRIGFCLGVGFVLLCGAAAQGRVNLPQLDTLISVSKIYHEQLIASLGDIEMAGPVELDENLERILIEILPAEFAMGCDETIMHWGTIAANSADLAVRAIYSRTIPDTERRQVLLVYRCFSDYEGYAYKFHDERLALLTVDDSVSTLQMLPHAEDCDNCSELSKIDLEDVLRAGGEPMLSLVFSVSNENPCCDGPYGYSAEDVHYYLVQQDGLKQVASVTRVKQEYFHDDAAEDLEVVYETAVELLTNADGDVVEIIGQHVTKENEKIVESGDDRYVWNEDRKVFELALE